MTNLQQVQSLHSHPASVDAYIRAGWSLVPIPPFTKGPRTKGWNERGAAIKSQAEMLQGYGIGLAHAYSGTMALDIDDWDMATEALAARGIDLTALYGADDAVIIDSGREGHGKLLYAMPFGLTLPSKKITSQGITVYELRCATTNGLTVQDVLPPTIHPETLQPYRWAGRGHWTRLPTIPMALLDHWQHVIEGNKVTSSTTANEGTIVWDEIESALQTIPADCSREEWITCGMVLHMAGVQDDNAEYAYNLWNTWSATSTTKYPGEREMATQWRSFREDKALTAKLGSLFHIARQHGWTKPMPDVSTMFPATTDTLTPGLMLTAFGLPPPDPNLSLVPEVLRTRAAEVSEHIGCDPLLPLFAGMAAVCGAIDARTRLELAPGFKVPPVLWIMTIGEPGDKKTPGSSPMFEILEQIEQEDRPRFAKSVSEFELSQIRYTAAKKHAADMAASPEHVMSNTVLPSLPPEPPKPVPVKIIVQDTTSQKLVYLASTRPRGLLCHKDEMASWAQKMCDPRSGEDRSAWTVSYEAKRYEMDRVGTGTTSADNFAVSFYGNMQPRVFKETIEALSKDGMAQRFIPVPLRPTMARLGHPVPACMTNSAAYEQMIRVCYGMPAMTYRLSADAYVVFREFQTWYQSAQHDERLIRSSETFQTAFGKLEGLAGRLALVWHCIEEPYSLEVSRALMERVIRFMRTYVIPVLRHVHDGDLAGVASFDKWMAEYIVQYADQPTIALTQIKRSARRWIEKMVPWTQTQMILGAMQILEDAKWVARMDDGSQEHRGVAQWAINPALLSTFEADRRAVIEAKQRVMNERYERGPQYAKFKGIPQVKGAEILQRGGS